MIKFKKSQFIDRWLIFNDNIKIGEIVKVQKYHYDYWKIIGIDKELFSNRKAAAEYLINKY
jgi:hypothetical protein